MSLKKGSVDSWRKRNYKKNIFFSPTVKKEITVRNLVEYGVE